MHIYIFFFIQLTFQNNCYYYIRAKFFLPISLFSFDCQITMMKVLILLSCLAYSIHAANPDVDNGMFQTMYNYLKSQPILLQEEQRQVIEFLFFNEIESRFSILGWKRSSDPFGLFKFKKFYTCKKNLEIRKN